MDQVPSAGPSPSVTPPVTVARRTVNAIEKDLCNGGYVEYRLFPHGEALKGFLYPGGLHHLTAATYPFITRSIYDKDGKLIVMETAFPPSPALVVNRAFERLAMEENPIYSAEFDLMYRQAAAMFAVFMLKRLPQEGPVYQMFASLFVADRRGGQEGMATLREMVRTLAQALDDDTPRGTSAVFGEPEPEQTTEDK